MLLYLCLGHSTLPPESFFEGTENPLELHEKLLKSEDNWIRNLSVYEISQSLAIKYYSKNDLYLCTWNKETGEVRNAKQDQINDDLGLGGKFPIPEGVYADQFIGLIKPEEVDKSKVSDPRLKEILNNTNEESNPIVVLYHLK